MGRPICPIPGFVLQAVLFDPFDFLRAYFSVITLSPTLYPLGTESTGLMSMGLN